MHLNACECIAAVFSPIPAGPFFARCDAARYTARVKIRNAMRTLILVFCLLCSSTGFAQRPQNTELQSIDFLKLSPAFHTYWTEYVRKFDDAYDLFRQAAQLVQCDKIPADKSLSLNPEFRRAIEEVMKSNAELVNNKDPQVARHLNRFSLYAFSRLTPQERASLLALAKDKEMLKYVANLYVLEDFQSRAIDRNTGQFEPAAVIWLKTYFQKEGQLAQLTKALNQAQPALRQRFEQLQSIERYSEADGTALSSLTKEFVENQNVLADVYAQHIPKAIVPRLQSFYLHPFHEWSEKARAAEGDPASQALGKELSSELAAIRDELRSKYPPPDDLSEKFFIMGPYEYAGKQVERFCPKKAG